MSWITPAFGGKRKPSAPLRNGNRASAHEQENWHPISRLTSIFSEEAWDTFRYASSNVALIDGQAFYFNGNRYPVATHESIFVGKVPGHEDQRGVFAKRPIEADQVLCEYVGKAVLGPEDQEISLTSDYNIEFIYPKAGGQKILLDASTYGSVGRFFNCNNTSPNTMAYQPQSRILIKTLRRIEAGEQLCWNYGVNFDDQQDGGLSQAPQFETDISVIAWSGPFVPS